MLKKMMALGLALCMTLGGAMALAEDDLQSSALENAMTYLQDADSLTIDLQFAIRQNGEDRVTGDMLCQSAGDTLYANANIAHSESEARDMELSIADDTYVLRVGDEFYSMPLAEKDAADIEETVTETAEAPDNNPPAANTTQAYLQTVMDQLFGSVSDHLTLSDAGLGLHLAGDEVPAILNLGVSMAGNMMSMQYHADDDTDATPSALLHGTRGGSANANPIEVTKEKPSLGSNLHIDRIDLDVAIEGQVVSGVQFSIVLSGTDADGAVIETELAAVVRILDVNATVPAAVDLTGVDMQPVKRHHPVVLRDR